MKVNERTSKLSTNLGDDHRSDTELVCAAQEGEKKAFVEIVMRYQGMVAGVTLAILHDFSASEDVAQEVFVKVWKNFSQLQDPAKFRSWLYQIARNTALIHLSKRKPAEALDSVAELISDPGMRPDERAVNVEERAEVLSALQALPENYRMPLVLFYREGKSARAVAEALNLTEGVVKKRLSRGREMLRQRLVGLLDPVLRGTIPGTFFTAAVAASIGAMAPPSAIAATAFTASTTSSSASGAAVPIATTTFMTSKFTIATAALISIVCIPVGYAVHGSMAGRESRSDLAQVVPSQVASAEVVRTLPEIPESELVLEWRRLKEEYGTDAEGLRAMHGVIRNMEWKSLRRRALMSTLIAEWAQREPGAIAFFDGRESWQRDLFIEDALKADGEALLDGLMASSEDWPATARHFLPQIAEYAPERLEEVALRVPQENWGRGIRDAFAIFSRDRPEKARAAAEAMSGLNRAHALSGVAMAWATNDGEAAFAWARELEDSNERDVVTRAVLSAWAKENPMAALDHLGEVPPGGKYATFASTVEGELLTQLGENDFEAVLDWMKRNPGKITDSSGLAGAVDLRLTATPREFLSQLKEDGILGAMESAIGASLSNTAAVARREVWEWTLEQDPSESVRSLRAKIIPRLCWEEPKEAIALVDRMAAGIEREETLKNAATFISRDIKNVVALDSMTDDVSTEWQSALAQATFGDVFRGKIEDAGEWADRLKLVEAQKRPDFVRLLARGWTKSDASASVEWVESLEESAESAEGIVGVAESWFDSDPEKAVRWVSELDRTNLDTVAPTIAKELAANAYVSETLSWLEQVESVEEAFGVLVVLVPNVHLGEASEVSDALQWIEESPLTRDQKDFLNKFLE